MELSKVKRIRVVSLDYIPTIEEINSLLDEGWILLKVVEVSDGKCKGANAILGLVEEEE